MTWTERNLETRTDSTAPAEKAKVLDKEKEKSFPTMMKEANEIRPFDPINLQPVISPGIYEAEFGVKGKDVLFHFWPYGYHTAERRSTASPRFEKNFRSKLKEAMDHSFEAHRVEIIDDADVGALCVIAKNWGDSLFARELCVKACEKLHQLMGGTEG